MVARFRLCAVVLSACISSANGHAILVRPTPRPNQVGTGNKLQPFGDARNVANRGCGGAANADPGVQIPKTAYRPGEVVAVEWQLTIPHPADVIDTGIRVALHYTPSDSFSSNILLGGLEGDPDFDDDTGDGIIDAAVPAAAPDAAANSLASTIVTLPAGKTCNYCTLQWSWAARQDGGFYMGCADIAITTSGLLPDYNTITPETGNELPQNNPNTGGGRSGGGGDDGGGGGGWVAAVVVLLLVAGGGGGYYYYKKQSAEKETYGVAGAGGAPPGGPAALPPGWTAAVDPASGRTYYSNTMTNETTWELPTAGPAPPPGGPPGGMLPPGWSEARDEASGRVYYINNTTGASTWEKPTNRF